MKTNFNFRKAGLMQAALLVIAFVAVTLTGCQKTEMVSTDDLSYEKLAANAVFSITHEGDVKQTLPAFRFQITQDGTLIYRGIRNVKTLGTVKIHLEPDVIDKIQIILVEAAFDQMQDGYEYDELGDHCITNAKFPGLQKQVVDYGLNTPDMLPTLKLQIETLVGVTALAKGI